MKHLIIAMSTGYRTLVRYSIVAGDAEGFFTIDPNTGAIRTASALDHEAQQFVLLNVLAVSDSPSSSSYTQVRSTHKSEIHNIIFLRERVVKIFYTLNLYQIFVQTFAIQDNSIRDILLV